MASAHEPSPVWSLEAGAAARPRKAARLRRLEIGLAIGAVLVVLLLLLAIEGTLRLLHVRAEEGALGPLHVYSDVYGWEPRKSFRMVEENRATTINARGYRGLELPAVPSGRPRVVVLGDSIGFGLEVGDEQTFAHLLGARAKVDVANLAVQGYDPGQELIKLERQGLSLKPDVVVLALCLNNDFADAALPVFLYDGRHPKPFFRIEGGRLVEHSDHLRLSFRDRTALLLQEHSRLYGLVAARMAENRRDIADEEHWMKRKKRAEEDRLGVVDLIARLVARMAEECREAGIGFVVLAFPDKDTFKGDASWLEGLLASPSLEAVEIVDMAELFRAQGLLYRDIALDGIGHLSANGHQAAARILQGALEDRGFIRHGAQVADTKTPRPIPE
jgi:lysophospholipase L1-like esterase